MFKHTINKGPNWDEIIIQNQYLEVVILSKGGTVKSINYIHEKDSLPLVLTYENEESYIADDRYCGAFIAPVAGRISPNNISLNGKNYILPESEVGLCLHSGSASSSLKRLKYKLKSTKSSISVIMWFENTPDQSGFPGNSVYYLMYQLTDKPSLRFETWINVKDGFAIFNPTNHMYFNFADRNILNHKLTSCITHKAMQVDSISTLEKERFDLFSEPSGVFLKDIIEHFLLHYLRELDHTFYFDLKQRRISLSNQNIEMLITTSYPCVRIYCASHGFSHPLKNLHDFTEKYLGIALECQYLDNDIQLNSMNSQMIVNKGEQRHEYIEYYFIRRNP